MARFDPQRARTLCPRLMMLALVWLLVVGGAEIGAAADLPDAPRKATLLDPADLVIFSTGEVKGALAPGG